jgi:hypothetical protein
MALLDLAFVSAKWETTTENTREQEPRGQAVTQSAAADWRDPERFRGSDQHLGCKLRSA